jgi:signal transduction histidine kinase
MIQQKVLSHKMEKIIKNTRNRFIAVIVLLVVFIVVTSWGILQAFTHNEIASPARLSEIHQSATENAEFGAYLEEQKEFEAHFLTLATSIKQQEADRVTRGLAITSIIVVIAGIFAAIFTARRLMKPVIEAYESQERFLQDAAHELRNPLAALTAALQQTKKDTPLVKTFRRQTNRLIHINEDLLYLEKRQNQDPQVLNISELLGDVIEELQPIAIHRKISISFRTEPVIQKKIAATDYVRLMKNIISNAIKYSVENSEVTITQKVEKSQIHIIVVDTGIGIPEKDFEHIGNRFFRASNTGHIQGTGLGLAIVQKILNTYGGTKKITSTVGKGTTVHITLPT